MFNETMNYTTAQNWMTLIGRILFSFIFILSGIMKVTNFTNSVAYIETLGLMFHPELLISLAIVFELGGSLLVLLGWHARLGALLLFIFTLAVSFMIHHFWNYPAEHVQAQMTLFLKNISIAGACLYILAFGAGDFTLQKALKKG